MANGLSFTLASSRAHTVLAGCWLRTACGCYYCICFCCRLGFALTWDLRVTLAGRVEAEVDVSPLVSAEGEQRFVSHFPKWSLCPIYRPIYAPSIPDSLSRPEPTHCLSPAVLALTQYQAHCAHSPPNLIYPLPLPVALTLTPLHSCGPRRRGGRVPAASDRVCRPAAGARHRRGGTGSSGSLHWRGGRMRGVCGTGLHQGNSACEGQAGKGEPCS